MVLKLDTILLELSAKLLATIFCQWRGFVLWLLRFAECPNVQFIPYQRFQHQVLCWLWLGDVFIRSSAQCLNVLYQTLGINICRFVMNHNCTFWSFSSSMATTCLVIYTYIAFQNNRYVQEERHLLTDYRCTCSSCFSSPLHFAMNIQGAFFILTVCKCVNGLLVSKSVFSLHHGPINF